MSYSQPLGAPFSHDSIELADRASRVLLKVLAKSEGAFEPPAFEALDLCSGCGVVGLEAERRLRGRLRLESVGVSPRARSRNRSWTFLEVQEEYRGHFQTNLETLLAEFEVGERRFLSAKFVRENLKDVLGQGPIADSFRARFDLIVSNPPYFEETQGRLPPNKVKAHSRFFLDAGFEDFIRAVNACLKPAGEAIFLLRDLADHGIDRAGELGVLSKELGFQWEHLEPIRGTGLVRLWKLGLGSDFDGKRFDGK